MNERPDAAALDDEWDAEYLDLFHQVLDTGWLPGSIYGSADGVTRQFREAPYTSDFPGMKERHATGKTSKDAFRNFLKQLNDEEVEPGA